MGKRVKSKAKHPNQPLVLDGNVLRFKANAIVRYLVDWAAQHNDAAGYEKLPGPAPDLNQIARMPFSQEDREQLAQLIGYSVSGYAELSYVSDKKYEEATNQPVHSH